MDFSAAGDLGALEDLESVSPLTRQHPAPAYSPLSVAGAISLIAAS